MNISFGFSPDFFFAFLNYIWSDKPSDNLRAEPTVFKSLRSFGDKLKVFTLFTRTNRWRMAEHQGKSSLRTSKFISWLTLFKYENGTRDDSKPLDKLRRKSQSLSLFRTKESNRHFPVDCDWLVPEGCCEFLGMMFCLIATSC